MKKRPEKAFENLHISFNIIEILYTLLEAGYL